jgi:hypothetical protein
VDPETDPDKLSEIDKPSATLEAFRQKNNDFIAAHRQQQQQNQQL